MSEVWMDIPGYEGVYQASSLGRIKRVGRTKGATPNRIITLKGIETRRYLHVDLSRNNVKKRFGVHRLVAMAFHGMPRTKKHVVNHKNGDKKDNRPENLEWCTYRQNAIHAHRTGLMKSGDQRGEKNGRSKLSSEQVLVIRKLKGKVSQDDLALLCGVARSLIQRIHQGKAWSHLEWPEDLRVRQFPGGSQ